MTIKTKRNSEDTMNNICDVNSQSVQLHLTMVQGIIERMASNSSSMKTWCISTVSAILVVAIQTKISCMSLVSLINIVVFWYMDAKYLALERGFRSAYNRFIDQMHKKNLKEEELFILSPDSIKFIDTFKSFSVCPFYGMLLLCSLSIYYLGGANLL